MKKLLFILLALCMTLCMVACGGDEATESSTAESQTESQTESSTAESSEPSEAESETETASKFTVTVVDQDGTPVPNVNIQLCKDSCIPAKTDENGIATFNVEITDGYKLSMMFMPEGYSYEGGDVYLESGATEYTLEITKGN